MWRAIYGSIGLALLLACSGTAAADAPSPDPALLEFFEAKVRPILVDRCFSCHGAEKQKGGLRLDSSDAMRSGGDTGPVVVATDPEHSPLIAAVRHEGDVRMPPKGKLAPAEIAALTEWVKRGAPWPALKSVGRPEAPSPGKAVENTESPFWAFQPAKDFPPPVVKRVDWPKSTLDAFILAKLEENGLQPSPPADKPTLLRRVTFDLIGLPPTPEEVAAFVNDASPDAYERVVDRLLASPHYGERWGRHWLDVARYGEDQAHSFQPRLYPNGFRYRDWVADALNADMPYDRFIVEQIAGDLLDEPGKDRPAGRPGLLRAGAGLLRRPRRNSTRWTTGSTPIARGFLGLTVACARCHDHKFDPIPTADYYSLAGVFLSTEYQEAAAAPREQVEAYDAAQAAVAAKSREIDAVLESESARIHASESVAYLLVALSLQADRAGMDRAAMQKIAKSEGLESTRIRRWIALLDKAKDHPQVKASIRVVRVAGGIADDESRRVALHAAEELERHVEAVLRRRSEGAKIDGADETLLRGLFDKKGPLAEGKDKVEKQLSASDKARLAALRAEKDRLEKAAPPKYPVVHALKDAEKPADANILVRGNPESPAPRRLGVS